MIGVKLHGRLGNQLFQYAFAYATAKKLNTTFYLDKRLSKGLLSKHFLITEDKFQWLDNSIFSIKLFKQFFSSFLKLGFYAKVPELLRLRHIEFLNVIDPVEEIKKIDNQALYSGFFQSERYFENEKSAILSQFRLKKKAIEQFHKVYSVLPQGHQLVVLHVRRTDYVDYLFDLPVVYFHKVITKIHNPNNFYVIISDDPPFARSEFDYLSNKYISDHNEIVDFQFLMNADICILSNSSFSWWGTYLNEKKKQVIAPKYWLGFKDQIEEPRGIILKDWETTSVSWP